MSSEYAQPPAGKAGSLVANEKVSTPRVSKLAPKPAAKPAPPPAVESASKALPDYHKTATTPFFPGQKPDHFLPAGKGGMVAVYVYGHGKPGPAGNLQTVLGGPAKGQTLGQSQTALAKTYQQNHPVGQQVIEGVANTVPGVALAKAVRDNKLGGGAVASEVFNDVTSGLVPVGKAAGIIGGLRGLKKIGETAKAVEVGSGVVARLPKAQQTAIQIVREGVPIADRIAAASTPKELASLKAAQKYVHDVGGIHVRAGSVEPYVQPSYVDSGVGSTADRATEKGFLYHRTSADQFNAIRQNGLRAGQPAGDKPAGVYFANHPIEAKGLSWKSHKGSVYVRVKKDAVNALDFTHDPRLGGTEFVSPTSVPPHALEYLGKDEVWHPVADTTTSPMPRIKPEHANLTHVYESALAQTPKDTLRGTLKGARAVRGKQEAGYSAERSTRFANASKFLNDATLNPEQRLALAKNELKGELPKIDFQGMKVLDEKALAQLQSHILDHPHLMPGQKIRAADALTNALAGKVPTNSELTLLEHVFGKTTADSLGQIHNHQYKDLILGALNVPRSLMASFDLSAPFRQGLVVSIRHPKVFAQNFGPMVKAFGSEKVYHAMLGEIHARPTYPMMLEAKLSLTELGSSIGAREEQFASDLAEKIPVAGRGVRMSARAYTGFLDKTRADVFDHLIGRAQAQGINVQDPKFLKDLGRYINSATGRGTLGGLQGAAPALNAVFFSPRLIASRLDLIFSPLTYAKTDPFVRREALKSMVAMAGTLSTLLTLASQVPGVKVVLDPRNPDWGKIRLGNTRIDIGGGFQQPLRLFAQLATGTAISSTTGKRLNLTAGGFGQPNRLDLFLRFFEGKESPIASLITDWARNSNQVGQKFDPRTAVTQRLIPLLAQDSYSLYKDQHGGMNGLAAAFAGYGLGAVGFGLQTYGPKPSKGRASSASSDPYGAAPSSGGSDYAQSVGSSGSDYAQLP